jgi:hypothetical protein
MASHSLLSATSYLLNINKTLRKVRHTLALMCDPVVWFIVMVLPFMLIFICRGIHAVMSCHVMSCHVMSCHVMSCHVMSCHVMSCHVMSCHVISCHVMSCHVACVVLLLLLGQRDDLQLLCCIAEWSLSYVVVVHWHHG